MKIPKLVDKIEEFIKDLNSSIIWKAKEGIQFFNWIAKRSSYTMRQYETQDLYHFQQAQRMLEQSAIKIKKKSSYSPTITEVFVVFQVVFLKKNKKTVFFSES